MARSLAGGGSCRSPSRRRRPAATRSRPSCVSPLTFGALRDAGARGLAVSEAEVAAAMVFAFRHLRIVAEPGGAVALAALDFGEGGDVPEGSVVVVSGGNVDPALYAEILRAG